MLALTVLATPRRHANVLEHMAGYFKNLLDAGSKAELGAAIGDYRRGLVPLVVPVTLLRHNVRVHGVSYLVGQLYLVAVPDGADVAQSRLTGSAVSTVRRSERAPSRGNQVSATHDCCSPGSRSSRCC